MLYGNRTMYDRALKTHEAHSHKFGYPMTVLRKPILGGLWSKPAIILSTLIEEMGKSEEQRVQWLFWFDADTILMNPNIPLETFLPPPQFSETHLLLTKDWNGMNNGVFFLRVHPWSIEFFSAIVSYPVIHPDAHLLWEDQSVMNRLKKEHEYFSRSMVYCPLRWFNAYKRNQNVTDINPKKPIHFQIHPGDIIVHFPGTPANELESTMLPYLEVAESHNPEWELPLEQTGYLREIAELWDEMSES
ncbi:glycosyltransferase family 34 protein [Aspergillus carbonarius ITEM 5010]|uniref:Glycosyltransferase family 34 protein n=1 Tax=Aspergillus carbonarius (strain ITEM 5010) TaxID=602072 RepID=A0A1R3RK99_ASPC5|nr:glycosyltransferase family 34 protein [Aspergillus carbonarius ITEM 5010]